MKRYSMHDLVHDLARSVVGDELIVIDAGGKVKKCDQKYCRYALLINYDGQTKLSDILPEKVRALHISGNSKLDPHDGLFSLVKRLRVLNLSDCSGIFLPSSINQLKQLRCLIAPKLQNKSFPEGIVALPKLQYLNLCGSSEISELPKSIDKLCCLIYLGMSGCSGIIRVSEPFGGLKSLEHLDMSDCSGILGLPDSIGNLSQLQHLDLSGCSGIKEIPESLGDLNELLHLSLSNCDSITRLPESIGRLNNLQYLDLKCNGKIRELPASFQKLQNLVHLDLSCCAVVIGLPEALRGLTSLEHLNMLNLFIGQSHEMDILDSMGNLLNLKYLNISHTYCSVVDFIGTLTNLEHLDLSNNWEVNHLPDSIANLNNLHTMDLSFCGSLKSLPESIGNLKKLQTLVLSYCMGLESLPHSLFKIPSLKKVLIDCCPSNVVELVTSNLDFQLILPLFEVRSDLINACSNLPLLEGTNVLELDIRSLENVWSVEEACKAKLSDKDKLSVLKLSWSSEYVKPFVNAENLLEQLVPPRGLKILLLECYIGESFPGWCQNISHHLPSLVSIFLYCLPNCNNLPPLGQLPNLEKLLLDRCDRVTKIGKDFCGGKGAFPRLSVLTLHEMHRLEEWCTTYSFEDGVEEFMFPVLDKLTIHGCPRLRLTPCPPVSRFWEILDSDGVISSLEKLGNNNGHLTSSTTTISLKISGSHCQSWNLFHHFTALKGLELDDCSQLMGLPESIRHLKSLESLELNYCNSILALPEWLVDLPSLNCLTIWRCEGLKNLYRAELKRWWESEGSRTKGSLASTT